MNVFKLSLTTVLVLMLFQISCAQLRLVEITNKDEISIKYQWLYKVGATRKYAVRFADIPNVPLVPTTYKLFQDKQYLIRNEAVVSGETILTIKVPSVDIKQFQTVRILHLVENDMLPSGREWQDCTIMPKTTALKIDDPKYSDDLKLVDKYNEEMKKYFADWPERKVSCDLSDSIQRRDEYFALTSRTGQDPANAFTKLKFALDSSQRSTETGQTTYQVSVTNVGNRPAIEVNFRSDFDTDSVVISVTPSQGRCQHAKFGSSNGSMVCYLGLLAPGSKAVVKFNGEPSPIGMSGKVKPGILNENWSISGAAKEKPEDPSWRVNWFTFNPITGLSEKFP